MKMKSIFKTIAFLGIFALVSACYDDAGTDILPGGESFLELDRAGQATPVVNSTYLRRNDGTTYPLSVQVNLMGRPRATATTVNFTFDATSTAVPGLHYNQITPGNSITIPAGENTANIEFEVLADNIEAGETWRMIVAVSSPDVQSSQYVQATWNLQVSCPSDLTGTYSFVSTSITSGVGGGTCGGTTSGSGTLTEGATNGLYTATDFSFGQFACAYGDTPPGGTLVLNDVCDRLFFTGIDKYGDSYTINVVSVTSTVLTIDWINTYGDGARVALTRTDAKTWPLTLRD